MAKSTVGDLKVTNVTQSKPFKKNGVAQVAVLFELSDGQTMTILLHNPDSTPTKIAPTDNLTSWKWLLNKRDVSAVVQPKQGENVQMPVLAARMLKIATQNSARFKRTQGKRLEVEQTITDTQTRIQEKQGQLQALNNEIQALQGQIDEGLKAKQVGIEPTIQEESTASQSVPAGDVKNPQSRAWQQTENKSTDPAHGDALITTWDSEKAEQLMNKLAEGEAGQAPDYTIRKFITDHLQGRVVRTSLGDCIINSVSRSELAVAANRKTSLKMRLIPFVPTILLEGETTGTLEQLAKLRHDNLDGFYSFYKWIELPDCKVKAQIKVGHRPTGIPLVYSLTENQKDPVITTRKASEDAATGSNKVYDSIEAEDDGEINIEILEVVKKPVSEPANTDHNYLQSIIDGKEDLSDGEAVEAELERIGENLTPELEALFEQAVDAYAAYQVQQASKVV